MNTGLRREVNYAKIKTRVLKRLKLQMEIGKHDIARRHLLRLCMSLSQRNLIDRGYAIHLPRGRYTVSIASYFQRRKMFFVMMGSITGRMAQPLSVRMKSLQPT